jgi:hypothetical protein
LFKSQLRKYYIFAGLVLGLGLLFVPRPVFAQGLDIPSLVQEVNKDRVNEGLPELVHSPVLDKIASMKARDMVEHGYFSHTSPQNVSPWFWFEQGGYKYLYAGENLALDFSSAADVQRAWMASPKHRDNILKPEYEEIGFAIASGTFTFINGENRTRKGIIVVQLFGKPAARTANTTQSFEPPLLIVQAVSDFSNKVLSQTDIAVKEYEDEPQLPSIAWPLISLGLALLMFTAPLHGRFVV